MARAEAVGQSGRDRGIGEHAFVCAERFAAGPGVGWLFGNMFVESVQLASFWSIRNSPRCPLSKDGAGRAATNIGGELTTVFLFSRGRFGYRAHGWCDRGARNAGRSSFSDFGNWVLGLNDVSGLFYWAFRILK